MFEHAPILLAAGWKDVLGALVPLAFLLIWVISQLAAAKKVGKPPAGRKPAAPPQPRRPAGGQPRQPPAGGMRDQVEEFLRRAGRPAKPGQRRPAADPLNEPVGRRPPQGPGGQQPPGGIQVLVDDQPPSADRGPLAEPLRPLDQRVGQSEGQPSAAGRRRRGPRRPIAPKPQHESVAEHVAEHVDAAARALGRHAAQLGGDVIRADEQFDVQLKAKFDHQLGTLASARDAGQPEQPAAAASPAEQIVAMLSDPAGVRQAIVLREILSRPIDRW